MLLTLKSGWEWSKKKGGFSRAYYLLEGLREKQIKEQPIQYSLGRS